VIPNFMIQGGGLDAKMVEKPTQAPVRNEAKNGLQNSRGTLAMARTSDPHSATSQFFINVKDNHALDFGIARDGWGYTVFGRVLSGMETVDAIVSVPTTYRGPHQNVPVTPVAITRVRVVSESATAPATPATTRPGAGRRPGVLRPGGGRLKPTPTPAKKP
jgi:cyclophilin family peptidyl-prolyl cis-trans isomerase